MPAWPRGIPPRQSDDWTRSVLESVPWRQIRRHVANVLIEAGGQVPGIFRLARLHLVEVTFTTDFVPVARVAVEARQHQLLCQLLTQGTVTC